MRLRGEEGGGELEQTRHAAQSWVLSAAILMLAASQVEAFDARVSWYPVPSVAGYRVYVRQAGQSYAGYTNVGLLPPDGGGVVRYIATGLPAGVVNYVAVTAYNGSGIESGMSNELPVSVAAATPTRTRTATFAAPPATATRTRTATFAAPPATATPQPSSTRTLTRTPTWTPQPGTATRTATRTRTLTPTRTRTRTPTNVVATATPSPTPTPTSIPPTAALTLWPASAVPANLTDPDPTAVELGVKFTSDVNGVIRGIRFYKGPANTGTHTGSLWTTSGQRLRTATFTGETATGWQQVYFASPVAISAGVVYVASYHTDAGRFSFNRDYFAAAGVDRPPLHAPRSSSVSGGNGVYVHGPSAFPTNTYRANNYWVDVIFSPS